MVMIMLGSNLSFHLLSSNNKGFTVNNPLPNEGKEAGEGVIDFLDCMLRKAEYSRDKFCDLCDFFSIKILHLTWSACTLML